MSVSVQSIVEDEISHFSSIEQQRLVDAGLHREAINAIGHSVAEGLIPSPESGGISALNLEIQVPEENIEGVREIVSAVVENAARWAHV